MCKKYKRIRILPLNLELCSIIYTLIWCDKFNQSEHVYRIIILYILINNTIIKYIIKNNLNNFISQN